MGAAYNKYNLAQTPKTEGHFKVCLEREKRKNSELKGLVARLQGKVKDASQGVDKCLSEVEKQTD